MGKNYKAKFKVIKDNKKDFRKKGKYGNIIYPRYNSQLNFSNKKIKLSSHDFGITYTNVDFNEKIKFQKNRIEYGEDFTSANGDIVILKYKYKGKNKIITSINIIGGQN